MMLPNLRTLGSIIHARRSILGSALIEVQLQAVVHASAIVKLFQRRLHPLESVMVLVLPRPASI